MAQACSIFWWRKKPFGLLRDMLTGMPEAYQAGDKHQKSIRSTCRNIFINSSKGTKPADENQSQCQHHRA